MAQTFDIRFANSEGLAGLFEAPANSFRWKGAGRLSIDAAGISIAVRRGLLTLFSRNQSRRIDTHKVIEVYREGNALRLEFSTPESSRTVLPFWVKDRDAAAQIVTLLPTHRSIELDHAASSARRYRLDRRLVTVLLACVVATGAFVLMLQRHLDAERAIPGVEAPARTATPDAMPDTAAASLDSAGLAEVGPPTPASAAGTAQDVPGYRVPANLDLARIPAPSMDESGEADALAPEESVSAVRESSQERAASAAVAQTRLGTTAKSAYEIAGEQLALFRAESSVLYADYLNARDSLAYERLEQIEARWLSVTSRIVNTQEFAGSEFYALRELEIAVSQNWRDHLRILAAALRAGGDPRLMRLADEHLEFARQVEAQLSRYGR